MDIIILMMVGFMAVLAAVIMMSRISLKRFLGYPNLVDITFSTFFVLTFHGTFAGMVVAGFASLFLSLILWALRSSIGAERIAVKRGKWLLPVLYWKEVPATAFKAHWLMYVFKRA